MKLTITKVLDRVKLIQFFRKEIKDISLQEAVLYVNTLPYKFENLGKYEAESLKKELSGIAEVEIEEESHEQEFNFCNMNINLPQEYIDAMAWYETLSEENKKHVSQIASWWGRPAVC